AVGVGRGPRVGGARYFTAYNVVVDSDELRVGPVGDLPDAALEIGGLVREKAEERLRETAGDRHRRRRPRPFASTMRIGTCLSTSRSDRIASRGVTSRGHFALVAGSLSSRQVSRS